MPFTVTEERAILDREARARKTIRESRRMQSSITTKGQTTIPKDVRDRLNLKPGDRVNFFFHPDGSVAIRPLKPVSALKGILKSRIGPVSIEDMNAGIIEGATARYKRFLNQ